MDLSGLAKHTVDILSSQAWVAVGSIATAVAVIVALVQVYGERKSRLEAETQGQASLVATWLGGRPPRGQAVPTGDLGVTLRNASSEPVYDVVVWLVLVQGAGPRSGEESAKVGGMRPATLAILPPGSYWSSVGGWSPGMYARPGVEVAFTDAAGRHWVRRAHGRLDQLASDSVTHYGLSRPVDWETMPDPM